MLTIHNIETTLLGQYVGLNWRIMDVKITDKQYEFFLKSLRNGDAHHIQLERNASLSHTGTGKMVYVFYLNTWHANQTVTVEYLQDYRNMLKILQSILNTHYSKYKNTTGTTI